VSKNQAWSRISGSSSLATSARIALKPHCASRNPTRSTVRRIRLYEREMSSRFGPRVTRAPKASRLPMETWL